MIESSQAKSDFGVVLSLCDLTGNMVKPWAAAGYRCICVDLQHPDEPTIDGLITRMKADVRTWLPPLERYAAVFAFTPCTDLAVSGARWFASKGLGRLSEALAIADACKRICEWSKAPWMLENPVSMLSTYWRKPDYSFDPYEYGGYGHPEDSYTKKTCLWVGGGFVMPEPNPVPATQGSKMHLLPPTDDRANLRSETPKGFAQAVFEANAGAVKASNCGPPILPETTLQCPAQGLEMLRRKKET